MHFHFITGGAGVGKSHTLRKMIAGEEEKYIVVAPTGIASVNVGGATIHSAFKIDPSTGFVNPQIKYGPLRGLRKIYIDEISMVSAELLESIYFAGGLLGVTDIIGFGDLAQLKPVNGKWFFEYREPDLLTRLTKNYRQNGDGKFAGALNEIRAGKHGSDVMELLNTGKGQEEEGVTLAFSNATVDSINRQQLAALEGHTVSNEAALYGNITERDVPAVLHLDMKPGAQIIMLNNDREKRFQNGTRGRIVAIGDTAVEVALPTGNHIVEEHTWKKQTPRKLTDERREYWEGVASGVFPEEQIALAEHTLRNGYEMETTGTFTQFPFKLGYASTVHKSQGLTLDKVILRPDGFDTMHGLGYVALSRLTSLSGLTAYRNLRKGDFLTNPKVLPYL